MAGTGVGKFSSTAGSNTANMTVNFAENMAPSNVNNAARELMGHMRDMYEQLGDGYFEFGDGDGTYTVARGDADTITITSASDISSVYFPGRKIRITDGGANVVEGTIASSTHASTTQTVNLTGISLAAGTPTKVELGIDTAAFGGRVILDDDGDTYIEAPTDDTIDIYVAGAKDFVITANTFTAESGSTIAAQALTATGIDVTGAITATAASTITVADNSDNLSLISTDADGSSGPNLRMYRNSGSPADGDDLGVIDFEGRNDASQDVVYAQIKSLVTDQTDGTEDGKLELYHMLGGSLAPSLQLTSTEVVINESSNDIDFRVESNGHAHAFFVNGGDDNIGLFNSAPVFTTGSGMHLGDNVKLGFGSGGSGRPDFQLSADSTNLALVCGFGSDDVDININTGGKISTGGEQAPDVDSGGLTLNQGAGDGNILTLKSSDVAHGITDSLETDTYFAMGKRQSAGGTLMYAMNSELQALRIIAAAGVENTTKGTTGNAPISLFATTKSGSGFGTVGSNANLLVIANNGNTKFIVDAEGDIHSDGSHSVYDNYDDAQLVRALDLSQGEKAIGLINSKFDQYVKYNHETLAQAKLVGREEDGTPNNFINVSGMQRLHNGAIWQQYEKTERLAKAVYELAKAAVGEDKANEILEQNEIKLLN